MDSTHPPISIWELNHITYKANYLDLPLAHEDSNQYDSVLGNQINNPITLDLGFQQNEHTQKN